MSTTYILCDLDSLPAIPLTENLDWLREEPPEKGLQKMVNERDFYERSATTVDNIPMLVEQMGFRVPPRYLEFIEDLDLVSRFRSPTCCGFYLPHLILGDSEQVFVDLMYNSQHCWIWYLHITSVRAAVVAGGIIDDLETIDHSQFVHCADFFEEFLRRLYIENELCFRLQSNQMLTPIMSEYLQDFRAERSC